MTDLTYLTRVDRTILSVGTLDQSDQEDTKYWLSKPPIERLLALEALRQQFSRHDAPAPRLQRLLRLLNQQDVEYLLIEEWPEREWCVVEPFNLLPFSR